MATKLCSRDNTVSDLFSNVTSGWSVSTQQPLAYDDIDTEACYEVRTCQVPLASTIDGRTEKIRNNFERSTCTEQKSQLLTESHQLQLQTTVCVNVNSQIMLGERTKTWAAAGS